VKETQKEKKEREEVNNRRVKKNEKEKWDSTL
jgi:hypothetical protein